MDTKRCNDCQQIKDRSEFRLIYRRSGAQMGASFRGGYCIPCERARSRKYQQEHREAGNQRVREWVERHPFEARITVMERQARYQWKKSGLHVEKFSYFDVLARDGWICSICGDTVAECALSFDHVIPRWQGGPHTFENVRVAHIRCNDSKGAKHASEARWENSFYSGDPHACLKRDCPIHSSP